MFDLKELMKNIDLGDVLSKFNLGEDEKKKVTESALEAVTYRTKKEAGKGNANVLENLFSQDSNTPEADNVANKLEGDLAYSLKNKAGMSSGVVDSIKSAVMSKVLGGFMNTGGKGILDGLLNTDMLSGFLGGNDKKSNSKGDGLIDKISGFFGN